mmetsp:Transcript_95739/g.169961  ORF Transcript_95739/g.169961 Transcript_95739/m.169961 type:complete len:201 (+) Transcript_95739:359-961(+)
MSSSQVGSEAHFCAKFANLSKLFVACATCPLKRLSHAPSKTLRKASKRRSWIFRMRSAFNSCWAFHSRATRKNCFDNTETRMSARTVRTIEPRRYISSEADVWSPLGLGSATLNSWGFSFRFCRSCSACVCTAMLSCATSAWSSLINFDKTTSSYFGIPSAVGSRSISTLSLSLSRSLCKASETVPKSLLDSERDLSSRS